MKKGISREKCAASLLAHLHNIVSQLLGFSTPSFFSLILYLEIDSKVHAIGR